MKLHLCPKCNESYGIMQHATTGEDSFLFCKCQRKAYWWTVAAIFAAVLLLCIIILGVTP